MNKSFVIGIIGGMGPESTVDYYQSIIKLYRSSFNTKQYPEIIIYSVNMTEALQYIGNHDFENLTNMLVDAAHGLKNAGADFAVIASNTPHLIFNAILEKSPIPIISIVKETAKTISESKIPKVLLLGTRFTMQNSFYKDILNTYNIETVVPGEAEQMYIHEKLMSEIEFNIIKDETKKEYLKIINDCVKNEGVQGVILGCTEFPLIIKESDLDIPVFNTTQIHVASIISHMKS